MISRLSAVGAALILLSAPVLSQTGSDGVFTIYNNSENNILTGFYSNDGTGWSDNWLGERMMPGDTSSAGFLVANACEQILQVGWMGEDNSEVLDGPFSIDICAVSNLYLDENEMSVD
jgi:hypothetical protein